MNRRNFLGLAAGLALTRSFSARAQQPLPAPTGFRGQWLSPIAAGYDQARRLFNGRIDIRPQAIAQVHNREDIALALRWAREAGLKVAVRGAGHSYEGFSLGNGLVIDTRALDSLKILPENLLQAGSGCFFSHILDELAPRNLTLPLGTCPGVGIAGYTLGGGLSLLSRQLGMGADALIEAELIDAQGHLQIANSKQNSDLFWALRGAGGGNFGILTRLTVELHPLDSVVLYRRFYAWEQLLSVVERWQQWAPQADRRIGSHLSLRGGPQKHIAASGIFTGSAAEWASLQPQLGQPLEQIDRVCHFGEAFRFLGGKPGAGSSPFFGTSDFLTAPLSAPRWTALQKLLDRSPATLLLDGLGGAIDIPPVDSTAYVHRAGNQICLQALAYQSKDFSEAQARDWLRSYRDEVGSEVSGRAYQNYPDRLRPKWDEAYYGSALPRLREIKSKYDPQGLFHHDQSL